MRRISPDTFTLVFGVAYIGLMGNAMFLVACLPVVFLAMFTDPAQTWLLLAILGVLGAPALAALFSVFRAYSEEGSLEVVRGFWRSWRATARKALTIGALVSIALVILVLDIRVLTETSYAGLTVPLLAVLAVLVVAITPLALAALADVPDARIRDLLKVSALLGVRRWYLTALSVIILITLIAFFAYRPALALGLAATPLLYVVWANSRFTLKPAVVDVEITTTATP